MDQEPHLPAWLTPLALEILLEMIETDPREVQRQAEEGTLRAKILSEAEIRGAAEERAYLSSGKNPEVLRGLGREDS